MLPSSLDTRPRIRAMSLYCPQAAVPLVLLQHAPGIYSAGPGAEPSRFTAAVKGLGFSQRPPGSAPAESSVSSVPGPSCGPAASFMGGKRWSGIPSPRTAPCSGSPRTRAGPPAAVRTLWKRRRRFSSLPAVRLHRLGKSLAVKPSREACPRCFRRHYRLQPRIPGAPGGGIQAPRPSSPSRCGTARSNEKGGKKTPNRRAQGRSRTKRGRRATPAAPGETTAPPSPP